MGRSILSLLRPVLRPPQPSNSGEGYSGTGQGEKISGSAMERGATSAEAASGGSCALRREPPSECKPQQASSEQECGSGFGHGFIADRRGDGAAEIAEVNSLIAH